MFVFHLIHTGPRLFQLPAPHPFFNRDFVNMEVLTLGINKTPKAPRSGSYMPLQQMMCRSADRLPHHTRTYKNLVHNGTKRIEQSIMDSFEYLKPGNGFTPVPSETVTPQEKQTKGLGEVGSWLYTRATFLDIPGKGSRIAHRDGLGFLMKRAWEMLLGVALIYEEIDTTERKDGRIKGPPALRQLLLQKKNSTKADKDVWYDARQKGFSSLVIFLLFGVAGWFHCHIDRRRFNPRDLFSLFGLVHQMANHNQSFLSPLRATDSKESGEIHVPWEHLNHHLSILLTSPRVGKCTLNWVQQGLGLQKIEHWLQDLQNNGWGGSVCLEILAIQFNMILFVVSYHSRTRRGDLVKYFPNYKIGDDVPKRTSVYFMMHLDVHFEILDPFYNIIVG